MKRVAVIALAAFALAGACRKKTTIPPNVNAANKVAVRLVHLYYENERMMLAGEPRNIPLPESPAAAIPVVVRELIKGPAAESSLRLFPSDTIVRGVFLLPGGTVVVELGGPTLTLGWGIGSHQELMAIQSVVQTVTGNFAEAKRVRIVVTDINRERAPVETLGGHVSLAKSFEPMPSLVESVAR